MFFSFSFFFCKPNSKNWFDFLLLSYSVAEQAKTETKKNIGRSRGFRFFSWAPVKGARVKKRVTRSLANVRIGFMEEERQSDPPASRLLLL